MNKWIIIVIIIIIVIVAGIAFTLIGLRSAKPKLITGPISTPTIPTTALDAFHITDNACIAGYNLDIIPETSQEQCSQICLDNPQCRSVDWGKTMGKCCPSDKTQSDVPTAFKSSDNYIYMERK